MSWTCTRTTIGSALALALVPLFAFPRAQAARPEGAPITKSLIATSELKWVPLSGITGAEQALLWGDPAKEAHRVFFKYPVGLKSPPHTHTFGDRGVIVSGTLSLAVEGAPKKLLPPGSFFALPAGTRHVTAVEGSEPCVFYMEREGPFDVVVVDQKQ